ncbi:MAG: RDD family protein [Candidatus Acidiferrales bacterium]
MYCSKCGANVPDGAVFCSACGQPTAGTAAGQPAAAGSAPPVAGYAPPVQAGWQAPAARPAVAYAGFWLRFVAIIIDAIVLSFVGWIVFLPFAASMGLRMHGLFMGHPPSRPEEFFPFFGMLFRLAAIRTVLNWLYFSLFESSGWQATLGKKALGLEVTDLAGRRISFGRATGRFFGKYISAIILFIGFIMAGFTEKKQALHDILAGTLVIRKV